jgi:hypothetical protein
MTDPSVSESADNERRRFAFLRNRLASLRTTIDRTDNAEKVRAFLALTLVSVLIALQFKPSGQADLTTAAETLAISVVAFYFGLHTGTPTTREARPASVSQLRTTVENIQDELDAAYSELTRMAERAQAEAEQQEPQE